MDQWASMISAVSSLIGSLGGVAAFVFAARAGSRRERSRAAEQAAARLLGAGTPDHKQALDEAIEYVRHHPEQMQQHKEGEQR